MAHYQHLLFDWVAAQPALTGAVILAAGLLSAFYGFRMVRFLLFLYCAGLGYLAGAILESLVSLPPLTAAGACLMGGAAALAWPRPALVLASGATWALLGGYLADEFSLPGDLVWIAFGLCGGIATVMAVLCRRAMTILLTSLQGAALTVVGFVGLSATLLPSISTTFRAWSDGRSLVVPVLMGMLATTAYSCQANLCQGDIVTGSEAVPDRPSSPARPVASRKLS